MLASFLHATILNHERFEDAVSFHLAGKLASSTLSAMQIREVILEAMTRDPSISVAVCADIRAVQERDPAVKCSLVPLLFLKGLHALIGYRVAHWLWKQGRELLALHFQNRMSEVFGVDIHPAARIGQGILMDHATSIVIGETGDVQGDVSGRAVVIGGKVIGNISATSIEILSAASIHGDIKTGALAISEGANFEGNCIMTKEKQQVIEMDVKGAQKR